MKLGKKVAIVAIAASSLIISSSPAFAGQINGSGATFAQPLIDVCKVEFTKDTGHTVNYTGGGSGKGRTDFTNNLVDFAASDAVYTGLAVLPLCRLSWFWRTVLRNQCGRLSLYVVGD